MDKIKSDIYPSYLELLRVNDSTNQADVLDITIVKDKKCFLTKLFDKRKSLPFETVCFPHPDSNIPTTLCYSTYFSQIIRYANINSRFGDFRSAVLALNEILLKRGYSKRQLFNTLTRCLRKKAFIAKKYNIDVNKRLIKAKFAG
jgi:hypothetical protein